MQLIDRVDGMEDKLRTLGFGYRSRFIECAIRHIQKQGGYQWLTGLRQMHYSDARACLLEITGVGVKVADCVCLMGLGMNQVVPIDTHMYKLFASRYKCGKKASISKSYELISCHFRDLWGNFAGWAQSILFSYQMGLK